MNAKRKHTSTNFSRKPCPGPHALNLESALVIYGLTSPMRESEGTTGPLVGKFVRTTAKSTNLASANLNLSTRQLDFPRLRPDQQYPLVTICRRKFDHGIQCDFLCLGCRFLRRNARGLLFALSVVSGVPNSIMLPVEPFISCSSTFLMSIIIMLICVESRNEHTYRSVALRPSSYSISSESALSIWIESEDNVPKRI